MMRRIIEVLVSSMFIFIVGYIIWPVFHPIWWLERFPVHSDLAITVMLLVVCVPIGIIAAVSGIRLTNFTLGGILAYVIGMAAIDNIVQPHSPVHYIGYGSILLFLLLGAALWTVVTANLSLTK